MRYVLRYREEFGLTASDNIDNTLQPLAFAGITADFARILWGIVTGLSQKMSQRNHWRHLDLAVLAVRSFL
jgi:hypothetical protein